MIVGRQFSSGCTEGITAGAKSRGRGNSVWPAPFIDALTSDNESGVRIKRFRDEVLGNWLAGIFRTPEDLARQVSAAIYRREIQDRIGTISLALESGFAETLMSGGPVSVSTLHTMKQSLATAPQLAVLRLDLRNGQY